MMLKKISSVVVTGALLLSLSATAFASTVSPLTSSDYQGKVDVGGFDLYVDIQGSANRDVNEPAVVFESGRQVDHSVWADVQSDVALTTQTVSYDRAGLGLSDDSGGPYDAITQAEQLHELLTNSGVAAPYVLVTHSYGSAITTMFTDLYPNEVAGVVFVDAAHVDQEAVTTDTMPIPMQDVFKAMWTTEGGYTQIVANLAQAKTALINNDVYRNIPLKVLSATEHGLGPVIEATWAGLQTDLLNLSDYSSQTIITGSEHYIMLDAPAAVVTAINDIL